MIVKFFYLLLAKSSLCCSLVINLGALDEALSISALQGAESSRSRRGSSLRRSSRFKVVDNLMNRSTPEKTQRSNSPNNLMNHSASWKNSW